MSLSSQIRKGISVDNKGTAYVVFWNAADAKNALDKLNGYNFQNRYLVGTCVTRSFPIDISASPWRVVDLTI